MRRSAREATLLAAGLAFFGLLPAAAALAQEPFLISLFSRILIFALAAVSLDLIVGYGAMVSFGHGAFFGLGGYVVAILAFHHTDATLVSSWPVEIPGTMRVLIAWPAAVAVAALFGALIGAISLRTSGIHFIMITLAFAQMLYYLFVSLETYGGDDGLNLWARNALPRLDLGNDTVFYYVCLGCLLAFLFVGHRLMRSRFGMVIRGCKQNERRMQALGFPTYRYKLTCFVISAAGAGLAGALIANQTEFVDPGLLHWRLSGELLVMVILGGMGTLFGPVLGATAFLLLEDILAAHTEHWMAFMGPLLIVIILFARRGIYGMLVGPEKGDG